MNGDIFPVPPHAASYSLGAILVYAPGEPTSKASWWGDLLSDSKKKQPFSSQGNQWKTLHVQGCFKKETDFKNLRGEKQSTPTLFFKATCTTLKKSL